MNVLNIRFRLRVLADYETKNVNVLNIRFRLHVFATKKNVNDLNI